MTGRRNGIVTQIQDEEPHALFTHCYGHSLNLAALDMIMGCKLLKAVLETTHELVKLIKYSPRREALFREVKGELGEGNSGLRVLCPTSWMVRADSMASVISNYPILQAMWEDAADIVRDTTLKLGSEEYLLRWSLLSFSLVLCWEKCCYVILTI